MWHFCKMMIFACCFFVFSKFWFSGLLGNSLAYHDFWYTCVKWWYLQAVYFVFSKFRFFGLLVGQKGKKWHKMTNNSVMLHISEQSVLYPDMFSYRWISMGAQKMSPNFWKLHQVFKTWFSLITAHSSYLIIL